MPLTINVGGSRKVSQDYNSRGFSLNIEGELPAEAINDPDRVAESAQHLFQLCDDLLDEQVRQATGQNGAGETKSPTRSRSNGNGNGSGRKAATTTRRYEKNDNGRSGNGARAEGRGITAAQQRAVTNMAKRLDYDPDAVAHEEFGTPVAELTVKQASGLIDLLKKEIEAPEKAGSKA